MDKANMKNMVVLKDLPSNIVEEAIIILKPNVKLKSLNLSESKNSGNKLKQNSEKYIINEAEMVISDYLSNIEKKKKFEFMTNNKLEKKYKKAKIISIFLGIVLFVSLFI